MVPKRPPRRPKKLPEAPKTLQEAAKRLPRRSKRLLCVLPTSLIEATLPGIVSGWAGGATVLFASVAVQPRAVQKRGSRARL
eukprot:7279590-Pyramimonas_sp.AAC.1